jgi:hypothetical protein
MSKRNLLRFLLRIKLCGKNLKRYLAVLDVSKNNEETMEYNLVSLAREARNELEEAELLFNEVEDLELINYAVLTMGAAERKYVHLIKKAREEKVIHEDLYMLYK